MTRRVHIVGRKNHGKTTLVADLLRELTGRGLKVGTLKHSSHEHQVDKPGKDSHRHRASGADPAAFVTPRAISVAMDRPAKGDPFDRIAPLFEGLDLVLIEGWIDGPGPKVEVWRAAMSPAPLATERNDIVAIVTDDTPPAPLGVPVWPRTDVGALADRLLSLGDGRSA